MPWCALYRNASIGYCRFDDRFPQLARVREEPGVVKPQPLLECGRGAQRLDAAAVEQLTRCSVWSRPVINNAAFEIHAAPNVFGKLCNCDVVTRADIDVRVPGIMPQKMETGVCEIVDEEEFTPGGPATPDDDFGSAHHFGFVKAAQQRRRASRAFLRRSRSFSWLGLTRRLAWPALRLFLLSAPKPGRRWSVAFT